MLTRTLPSPNIEAKAIENTESPEFISQQVDERGFYLYEWISPDELRMTLDRDYLQIVRWASIPLAIITAIAGFIWFVGGPLGTILAVLGVLGVFYFFVGLILFFRFLQRSYLYTRGANVVITDDHYISSWVIIQKSDQEWVKNSFWRFETIFDEPFLGISKLAEKKEKAKTELFDNLKEIASGGWKVLQNISRSRDSGWIVVAIVIAGFLYAAMMGIVYFIGIFFISLFGRIFAWLAHRYLLAMNNTEHRIQTLFSDIGLSSDALNSGQEETISLLTAAGQNEWTDNLSGRLAASFELTGELARTATDNTIELRSILESSKYKDIFNWIKYGNWVKKQVLEPIEAILLLLIKNRDTLTRTIASLDTQIQENTDPSLQKPLILQQERFEMQIESITPMIEMLEGYKAKLNSKK